MIRHHIPFRAKTVTAEQVVLYNLAVLFALVHIVLTHQALRWTHPDRSDPWRFIPMGIACLCLSSLLTHRLFKTITYATADRRGMLEACQQFTHSLMFYSTLSALLVVCNLVALLWGLRPEYLWMALPAGWGLLWVLARSGRQPEYQPELLRGASLLSMQQVRNALRRIARPDEPRIIWAGQPFRESDSAEHFLIVGTTRSGKTVALRLLLASILPDIVSGSDWRALVFDPKGDMLSIIKGIAPHCPVHILNPFDARCAAWDMARDVTSPATTLEIASIIIKMDRGDNSFFVHAARGLMAAVMDAFILSRPGAWTLADVVLTLSDQGRTESLLRSVPATNHKADQYFGETDPRTVANVMATVSAHAAMLEPIAAAWARASYTISLSAWCQEESILVLGHDETLRNPMSAVNLLLLQRLFELILSQSESDTRRTYVILDELPLLGKLEALTRFMDMARSKGGRVAVTFQLIEEMRAIYGEHMADAIAGLPGNKALLLTHSVATARWAADTIGKCDVRRWSASHHIGKETSTTYSEVLDFNRETVMPSQIMRLPRADRRRFCGYFVSPLLGAFCGAVNFGAILPEKGHVDNYVPRPVTDQYLESPQPPQAAAPAPMDIEAVTRVTADPIVDDDDPLKDLADPPTDWDDDLQDLVDFRNAQ